MLELMTIRCDHCGQENNPNYRFCGMCGAPLKATPPPRLEASPERTRPVPLTGPSFLGLGDETSRDFEYLLEEEESSSSHAAFYIVLLLVIAGVGFSVWRWHDDLYAWAARIARSQLSSSTPASAPPASTPPPPAATDNPNEPHAATVTEQDQSSAPKPAGPESAAAAQPSAPQDKPAATNSNSSAANAENTAPSAETSKPEKQEAEAKPGEASDESDNSQSGRPFSNRQSDTSGPKETTEAAPTTKAARPKPSAAVPALSEDDRLVAEGERYLYGTGGVRPDCDRAQRNLIAGARASNTKAYTLLGAMYATGHCVSRDLPTSYRWFARALHQEPSNVRLERNLEVIWRQMTPEEKQIAQRNQ
jgi:zinc-ribbon domain